MQRIEDNILKSLKGLSTREESFRRFIGVLQQELDTTLKGLITAEPDKVQRIQGKAQALAELIDLLN